MAQSHKIYVAICKWEDRTSQLEWTPLYSKLSYDGKEVQYDAYGRTFGESNFQAPREFQKQDIDGSTRYYCFSDYGEKTIVYKEEEFGL